MAKTAMLSVENDQNWNEGTEKSEKWWKKFYIKVTKISRIVFPSLFFKLFNSCFSNLATSTVFGKKGPSCNFQAPVINLRFKMWNKRR